MPFSMSDKKSVTREIRRRCRRALRSEKATMLDELVAPTGWTRSCSARILRTELKNDTALKTRERERTYTGRGGLRMGGPKTPAGNRKIFISEDLAVALTEHK